MTISPKARQARTTAESFTDDEIKAFARRDRRSAMGLVVMKYRARLCYHALSILKDAQEAGDVVQEVFIRAMREPRLFEEAFGLRAWLFRVTTNLCYNIVRDRRRRIRILEDAPSDALPQGQLEESREVVLNGELREGLLTAMDRLSDEHRRILLMRYYHDLSYNEIADALDIKLGTVMSRLSRAKARLSAVVDDEAPAMAEAI